MRLCVLSGLALAGAACGSRQQNESAASKGEVAERQPEPPKPVSIIRPDVDHSPVVEEALSPLERTVNFPEGGSKLDASAQATLDDVIASSQSAEGWPIMLRGHSDSAGSDEANLRASRRRAEAVATYLIDHGVEAQRISIVALGEQRPVAPNAHLDGTPDEAGRARNRRVDLEIAPLKSADGKVAAQRNEES